MFRLSSSVCPFCEARALFKQPWTPSRPASTLQQRRPSRMTLSPRVSRGPVATAPSGKAVRKSRNSPFGGMNITSPPREHAAVQRKISAAEERRSTRFTKDKGKRDERKAEPFKALKMQRALSQVSYGQRSKTKLAIGAIDEFAEFDLLPVIQESIAAQALRGLADVAPTPVQRLAIPALLGTEDGKRRRRNAVQKKEMEQFLLAAETGSGKTLAYLLPVIDAIKRAEVVEAELEAVETAKRDAEKKQKGNVFELPPPVVDEPHPSTGRPRAIILLPTSELVAQVGALVKSLSHTVKFRSATISSNFTGTVIRSRLFSPGGIDVLISTPSLLSSITESDPNVLSRVSHLVIDEADSLLDRSFSPLTSAIVDRATPSLKQLILCSATIPRSLDSYLHKRFPDIRRLVTPNLHAIPRRVQLGVVDIDRDPYRGNRDLACAQTIWDIGKEAEEAGEAREKKIVVFVNERERSTELAQYLRSKGVDATALSRDSDERKQAEVLASFTGASVPGPKPKPPQAQQTEREPPISPGDLYDPSSVETTLTPARRQLANTRVLVMTDLGSRGIDTLLVRHVVLYDVPHTSIDFIHRLGRVGRMGRRGRGVVLVGKNDRKDVVREVRDGMFKGQALI